MNPPDWRDFAFDEGVLPEPISDGGRLVLWLPADRDGNFQYWERIGNVARAEITLEDGLCATAATSIRARQLLRRSLGQLLRRLREPKGNRDFSLPNGRSAQQCGERRTDLMLVWTEDQESLLDLDRVKSRWPQAERFQKLGRNLVLGLRRGTRKSAEATRGESRHRRHRHRAVRVSTPSSCWPPPAEPATAARKRPRSPTWA